MVGIHDAQRSSISVVRVFEDEIFILSKISLFDEMFILAINPALRLYNVTHRLYFVMFNLKLNGSLDLQDKAN